MQNYTRDFSELMHGLECIDAPIDVIPLDKVMDAYVDMNSENEMVPMERDSKGEQASDRTPLR